MKKKAALLFCFLMFMVMTGCHDREAEFFKETETVAVETVTESPSVPTEKPVEEKQSEKAKIYVDVCGAVVDPGVFCLPEGSRVFQAVEAAGGFLPEAAETYVNRAQGLSDGEQIYVPTKEDVQEQKLQLESAGSGQAEEGGEKSKNQVCRVNLNTADETELCTLSGIGTSKAKAIISYREENGPFSSVEELMEVEGIKEGTFEKIKDEIEVG